MIVDWTKTAWLHSHTEAVRAERVQRSFLCGKRDKGVTNEVDDTKNVSLSSKLHKNDSFRNTGFIALLDLKYFYVQLKDTDGPI